MIEPEQPRQAPEKRDSSDEAGKQVGDASRLPGWRGMTGGMTEPPGMDVPGNDSRAGLRLRLYLQFWECLMEGTYFVIGDRVVTE